MTKESDPLLSSSRELSRRNEDSSRGYDDDKSQDRIRLIRKEIGEVNFTDGGYSWVVLLMLVISNILTRGFVRTFGILTNEIAVTYPDASSTLTGAMIGLLTGFNVILAPVSGGLINTYGVRSSILLGTFLTFAGLIASSALDEATLLPLTLCAITGAGLCFIESVQVVVIADYFKSKLPFANGIRVCGKSLGGMVAPAYLVFLLDNYGLRHTYLLIAAMMLHTLLVAAMIQPPHIHKRLYLKKLISTHCIADESNLENRDLLVSLERHFESSSDNPKKFLELRIFKNPRYLLLILITIGTAFGIPLATLYIPIYGDSIGLTPWENSVVLMILSFCDLVFRLVIGWIISRNIIKKYTCVAFCLMIGGISTAMIPLTYDMVSLIWASCFFALAYASYFEFINVILCDAFGKEIISTTWGFVSFARGVTNIVVSYLIGYMMSYSGNLDSTFVLMGCGMMVASVLLLWESIYERRHVYYSL